MKGQKNVVREQKRGFKTIEITREEINEQILAHRKKNFKMCFRVLLLIGLAVLTVKIVFALRSYDTYEVKKRKVC